MTARQLRRLGVALVVVLFLWGVAEILGGGSDDLGGGDAFAIPAVTAADVDTVRIRRPADTIVLAKKETSGWTVNGHPVAPDAIGGLFEALAQSSVAELAAQSPSTHGRMGVDSASGKFLQFARGGAVVAELVLGQRGPGYSGAYVRPAGQDPVYLIRGRLPEFVDRTVDDWRDKRIAEVTPDSVREVRVAHRVGRGSYTLRRGEAGWQFSAGGDADSLAVRRMLEQYESLDAGGFPTPAQLDSVNLLRPDRRVTLLGRGGPLLELLLDSTAYWWSVKRSDRDEIYRLESWRVEQMLPADSTLKQKAS